MHAASYTKQDLRPAEPGLYNHLTQKTELRNTIRTRLQAIAPEQFSLAGLSAARQLTQLPFWKEARSVLAFFSMRDEIDTLPVMKIILENNKSLFTPAIEGRSLAFYRILAAYKVDVPLFGGAYHESKKPPELCLKFEDFPVLVITPGLAFDRSFYRLGRGRGYYDSFFADLDSKGWNYSAVGFCMDCQIVDKVPVDSWDKKMDGLSTEKHLYQ